ncbi:NTF2 fold immunity protein [Segetibacter koreensis]|uniref:NTF2 fold immunity protein n=1 Tax=Segetibacter koreensis TaxID=398037 RepID=UPI000365954E|nr:NTF2 fold immunity protein [Segetibacter koreensis]
MTKLLLSLIIIFIIACNSSTNTGNTSKTPDTTSKTEQHAILGRQNARRQMREALEGKGQPFTWDTLIKTSSTAIATAEPILFDAFGKEQVLNEKPYEVYLIDGYWYITGTVPKKYNKGGAFEIIFSARDGKIIRLTHYK